MKYTKLHDTVLKRLEQAEVLIENESYTTSDYDNTTVYEYDVLISKKICNRKFIANNNFFVLNNALSIQKKFALSYNSADYMKETKTHYVFSCTRYL